MCLLVDTWNGSFKKPKAGEKEPTINRRFCVALQAERRRKQLRFSVLSHVEDLMAMDPRSGKGYSVIDFAVSWSDEATEYFGIEAKCLNVRTRAGRIDTKAGKYVGAGGMGCFVSGRYSPSFSEGAMVGYVTDGNVAGARNRVVSAILRHRTSLAFDPATGFPACRHLPTAAFAFETEHSTARGRFSIHHVLLG